MESIHKRSGKRFTGRFAETAVRIGLAEEISEVVKKPEVKKPAVKTPAKKAATKKRTKK